MQWNSAEFLPKTATFVSILATYKSERVFQTKPSMAKCLVSCVLVVSAQFTHGFSFTCKTSVIYNFKYYSRRSKNKKERDERTVRLERYQVPQYCSLAELQLKHFVVRNKKTKVSNYQVAELFQNVKASKPDISITMEMT